MVETRGRRSGAGNACARYALWTDGLDRRSGGMARPGDAREQTRRAMQRVHSVLDELGCDAVDLVKLLCFYVPDDGFDEDTCLASLASMLPAGARPAVTMIPVSYLSHPGMRVLIEGAAMRDADGARLPRQYVPRASGESGLPAPFETVVRCGKMIFVSGQAAIVKGQCAHPGDILGQTRQAMQQVGRALAAFGATFDDVVKVNRWYVGRGRVEDFEPAALACAAHFNEPGPAATGIPLANLAYDGELIRIEVVAMLGEDGERLPRRHAWPDSLWDWTTHLPYQHGLKCHDMIFLGGQVSLDKHGRAVSAGDMEPQTRQAMTHIGTILHELDAGYADICKLTTMYEGRCGVDELDVNRRVRSSFFEAPRMPMTDVPQPVLAYPGMIIEIDAFAVVEPD
ncbi:RidA family protein [Paraburkholderia terrae]